MDDHNNPALVLEEGQPPIALYQRHGADNFLRYRIGTGNFVAGEPLPSFAAEQTIDFGAGVTYTIALVHGTDLYVFVRGPGLTRWGFVKSTDWGQTWSTPIGIFSSTNQVYMAATLAGDTVRCAMSTHPINGSPPDQNIYYAEIDLLTGDISAGGSVLGNLDGSGLPIAWTSLEQVAAPATGRKTWCYDVSDGPNPEVVWASYDTSNLKGTSMYHYSVKSGGSWSTHDIVAAGDKFATGLEPYLGGAQMPRDTPGGVVWTARQGSGGWHVEEQVTANGGVSWAATLKATDPIGVVRAWPIETRGAAAPPFEFVANWINQFPDYDEFNSLVGPSRDGFT